MYISTIKNNLNHNDTEYVNVNSISELEDLYTNGVITYWQYLNIKDSLQDDKEEKSNM